MRIGCLQFAPQVGDVDNNLNRADRVLTRANEDDLYNLDLLVLPELAFTGYNFESLQHISPFLEPRGSGISSLWARTTALKYNTTVIVGYPEKVDVSPNWPTSPEYYNSAIVVNGDGETIGNYRKSFLYMIDETWALEGKNGFFEKYIPGVGHTAMGICMDLNPYKFEAPWHAFEFAFHVLQMEANVVVLTMAWLTREDGRMFSRMPAEPDMDTLMYWVQRLEPLIRAEREEEIIVIFCNRTGVENGKVYAGTSAVIGIKDGEVNVYGLLGRGMKELLIVDTNAEPFAKLVNRPEGEGAESNSHSVDEKNGSPPNGKVAGPSKENNTQTPPCPPSGSSSSSSSKEATGKPRTKKRPPQSITIPTQSSRRRTSPASRSNPVGESHEDDEIPTPSGPSPVPRAMRPKLVIPGSRPTKEHADTPFPRDDDSDTHEDDFAAYSSHAALSNDSVTPITTSEGTDPLSAKFFWVPPSPLLQTPLDSRISWPPFAPDSPTATSVISRVNELNANRTRQGGAKRQQSPRSERSAKSGTSVKTRSSGGSASSKQIRDRESNDQAPPRPASPKSRNASRSGRPLDRRNSELESINLAAATQRLEELNCRPGSVKDSWRDDSNRTILDRPSSPKSRNASRNGRPVDTAAILDDRAFNVSQMSIPIGASPSIMPGSGFRPRSDIFHRVGSPASHVPFTSIHDRSSSRPGQRQRSQSRPDQDAEHPRSRSASGVKPVAHIEPDETRTMIWSELQKIVGEAMDRSDPRPSSRGRQRAIDSSSATASSPARPSRAESWGGVNGMQGARQTNLSHHRMGNESVPARQSTTMSESQGSVRSVLPEDIIAEITIHAPGCPVHTHSHTPSNSGTPSHRMASAPDVRNSSRPGQSTVSQTTTTNNRDVSEQRKPSPPKATAIYGGSRGQEDSNNTNAFIVPAAQNSSDTLDSLESLPAMSGSSIHTITTSNGSPSTPSPRVFEPATPKAMKLDPDFGTILSSVTDPTSSASLNSLNALAKSELAMLGPDRPKSAVW